LVHQPPGFQPKKLVIAEFAVVSPEILGVVGKDFDWASYPHGVFSR
jgi:hypothetical protein